jgi:hypothetical protein
VFTEPLPGNRRLAATPVLEFLGVMSQYIFPLFSRLALIFQEFTNDWL